MRTRKVVSIQNIHLFLWFFQTIQYNTSSQTLRLYQVLSVIWRYILEDCGHYTQTLCHFIKGLEHQLICWHGILEPFPQREDKMLKRY